MSGRKGFLASYKLISQGDMSQNVTSNPVSVFIEDNIGFQINVTAGTASGTFTVQISADYNQNTQTGNWITLLQPNSSTPVQVVVTSGSPANSYIDLNQISAPWIRLIYTVSSGTGNFDAIICGKML